MIYRYTYTYLLDVPVGPSDAKSNFNLKTLWVVFLLGESCIYYFTFSRKCRLYEIQWFTSLAAMCLSGEDAAGKCWRNEMKRGILETVLRNNSQKLVVSLH